MFGLHLLQRGTSFGLCCFAPPPEWNIIYDKLAKCAESGAKIVLSRYAIGDLATQYFADRDIFCAGRVSTPCASLASQLSVQFSRDMH